MDVGLRRSAAHVHVDDVDVPGTDDATDHHVRHVLRLRDGAAITVTDGCGRWRQCRLVGDQLEAVAAVVTMPPPETVTICAAMPKGDRADWLVQKCSEVGVDRIVVVTAQRSVLRWEDDRAVRHLERLRRIAVEASLQSRRVWFPSIEGPVPALDVLPGAAAAEPGSRALRAEDRVVAIGPEGGWTPAELAVAGDCVDLGPHVLRVETAAMVAAAHLVALREAAQ